MILINYNSIKLVFTYLTILIYTIWILFITEYNIYTVYDFKVLKLFLYLSLFGNFENYKRIY